MKRIFRFLSFAMLVLLMVACSPSPKSVTQKYFHALENKKYEKALSYTNVEKMAYKETAALLEFFNADLTSYEVLDVKMISDSTAVANVKVRYGDYVEETIANYLEKKDGKWKIVW